MRMLLKSFFSILALMACITASSAADEGTIIKGQVILDKVPKVEEVVVTADKAVCCKDGPLASTQMLVDPKSKGVKNVIVWLRPNDKIRGNEFPKDKIPEALRKPKAVTHIIDQPKCQFEPRVLAARAGDKLIVKNSASIAHNVNFASPIDGQSFNKLLQVNAELAVENAFTANRFPIAISCNIHPWMAARIRVFDHPFYATTDANGKFEIKGVPEGTWNIVYWHEGGFHMGIDGIYGFATEVKGKTLELKPVTLDFAKKEDKK